jgi:hypothetical protein
MNLIQLQIYQRNWLIIDILVYLKAISLNNTAWHHYF